MTETPATIGRRGRLSDEELAGAAPKKSGGKDMLIGIFVLSGLLAFVAILFLLTDPATMRGRYMLVTTVQDAGGVRRGDPVQMRGVIIGRINGFLAGDKVLVSFANTSTISITGTATVAV